ncbi:MAG TPA: hypothetical protein PLB74_00460 [Candidatus Paceibacterota bacterium]|nr:hypothetical protein [Candidatus Paceibacterota bacterium]
MLHFLYSITTGYLPFVYFLITVGLIIAFKKIKQFIKPAVILILVLKIWEMTIKIVNQYYVFKNSDIGPFLLPPHQQLNQFFFHYVDYRIIYPIIFPILVGLLFFFLTKIANRLSGERFFEKEESWMFFYGIMLVGHPLWVVYVFAIFIIGLILYLLQLIFKKINFGERLPLYYLWLPLALLIFLLQGSYGTLPLIGDFLSKIKF